MSRLLLHVLGAAAFGLLIALAGCGEPEQNSTSNNERAGASSPPAAVKLTVVVAADEQLAEGVRLLSGEWKARSGGELEVESVDLDKLKQDRLAADVVIFPSRQLGNLVEQSSLRPMRDAVLASPQVALNDIFPAIRYGEMRYGGQTWALPLGSPPLLMCWRPTLAGEEPSGNWPPHAWNAYRQWIGAGSADVRSTTPPLADRAAAYTLIARALAYVEAPRRPEAMFDPDNMSPRITGPPWVQALTQIVEETHASAPPEPAGFAAAMAAVRSGQSLATLGWPGIASGDENAPAPQAAEGAEFALLPVAERVYSETRQVWENQLRPQSVTLLGVEGRLIAVTQSSRNAVSAFGLCQWLTSGDVAIQLSSRSDGTLWYRKSQAAAYGRWLEVKSPTTGATPVTHVIADAMETDTPVLIPRVPGIDEYLNVLAEAVRSAQPGEPAAREALTAAAAKWEELTERLGREAQTRAYQRHLGVEAFEM